MSTIAQVVTFLTALNQPTPMPSAVYLWDPKEWNGPTKCQEYGETSARRLLVPEAHRMGHTQVAEVVVMCLTFERGPQESCSWWRKGGFQCHDVRLDR